ncbi:MAG: nuclear transport factor 2 family protein [Gammaproteobacteria bacterium]
MAADRNLNEKVRDTIYKACLHLDDEKWDDWLALCDEDFEYAITAYSPEISYDMTYLSGNRADMAKITEMLPKHNTDHSPLRRHATVYCVEVDETAKTATAITSLAIYQNMLDGVNSHVDAGEPHIFIVGRYLDTFRLNGEGVKFTRREVRLDTRRLDKGSHWPL